MFSCVNHTDVLLFGVQARKTLKDIVVRRHEAAEDASAGAWDDGLDEGKCEGTSFPLILQRLMRSAREESAILSSPRRQT